jgi:GrpB-like predicted nucleotidyltransferase (UPF0157 family)
LPTSSAGFFSRGGLGLPSHVVKLARYNPNWPQLFIEEKQRVAGLLAKLNPQIEHIGSTSVPGMDAKPVIDIMLGIKGPEDIDAAEAALLDRGYVSHGEKGIPGRLFFTYGEPPTLHLHMVTYNGPLWKGHLLFRDTLTFNKKLADSYVSLKINLAKQFPTDRQSYTAGKADFIESVLRKARVSNQEVKLERESTPL